MRNHLPRTAAGAEGRRKGFASTETVRIKDGDEGGEGTVPLAALTQQGYTVTTITTLGSVRPSVFH